MPHPDPRFYENCTVHNLRYCYACYPVSGPTPKHGLSLEDELVGRPVQAIPVDPVIAAVPSVGRSTTAFVAAPSVPIPTQVKVTSMPVQPTPQHKLQESPEVILVRASEKYRDCVAAVNRDVRQVQDLEKRLEMAKADATDAIAARDKALELVRELAAKG